MGTRPNKVIYCCLIHALCNLGQQKEARRLLNKMMDSNISLNVITYNILINAYCKEGMILEAIDTEEMVSKAEDIVGMMRKQGIEPTVVTYLALIDGIACKRKWRKLEEYFG
ncbi:hypothetical protein V6N12_010715 [Hibiscus sabdariffa]|uniref:Pentatricopeptide repeat-containing protein n=1 Tax=Hibiscus sabdariffa TaxID=183260 RepID=A0ABR2EKY5_9ROSI